MAKCVRFRASGIEGRRTGRHGNRIRGNDQLVPVPASADHFRFRQSSTGSGGVILRGGDDDDRQRAMVRGRTRDGQLPERPRWIPISSDGPNTGNAVSV